MAVIPEEPDFAAAMFQREDELPIFLGKSIQEHVSAWISVQDSAEKIHWRLAAIAHSYQANFGPDGLKDFAGEVGLKASTMYHYARTYRRFSAPNCQRWQTLHFSIHMIAASQKTPEETQALLEMAELGHWSAETTREHVRKETFKKQIPESTNPDDEYDRHVWEKEARPAFYRFIRKCPKFKRQVSYVISEIDGWFRQRSKAPVELIGQKIREGCETAELIAEEVYMTVGAVQLLLNDLVAQGRVRAEKELKITEGARGATRTRYSWIAEPLEMSFEEEEYEDVDDDE